MCLCNSSTGDSTMNLDRLFIAAAKSDGCGRPVRSSAYLLRRFAILTLLVFPFLPATRAQVSASIKGMVMDASGAAVPGVTVTAKNVETGAVRSSVTDDAGRYLLLALHGGEYEVRVTKAGFRRGVSKRVFLVGGQEGHTPAPFQNGVIASQMNV